MLLQISEPFWKTVEFYCCLFTAVIVVIIAAYRHKINRLKHLSEVRQRIARDLHDDIGSTLSSISMLSKMAASDAQAPAGKSAETFSTIGSASAQAMSLMSDIVWSVNPENDKMPNVISRMREYAAVTLEASQIHFRVEASPELERMSLPMEKRKDFYLIFKEAVNNLAKYSSATEALLKLTFQNRLLTLEVKDNGRGFDNSAPRNGNGLKNMRARADVLNAKFDIASAPGSGTSVKLSLQV